MPILLVVDDEESVRYSFRYVFQGDTVQVLAAATAAEGLSLFQEQKPDVLVLDLQLPDRSGLELYRDIHALDPKRPVIFITAHGTTETAIEAMKRGAFDYLVKPVDLDQLSQVVTRAFEAARLMQVTAVLPIEEDIDRIVGRSSVIQEMCKAIGRIAPQNVNVLISGESGTGKELVARALYHHSQRAEKAFLAINCAAIPEALLESELFGHEQGAFTGAHRRRIGKFEQADGGTLFLDEIGDMSPALQAKMLRVLQDQQFERVGGGEIVRTHVRILAATNRNLAKLVDEGRFRQDLYYRLKVVSITVPPLREHPLDVPELANYFLFRFNRELGLDFRGFAPEAIELLQKYHWPGNVRELQSVTKHAMLSASGSIVLPDFLPAELHTSEPGAERPSAGPFPLDLQSLVDQWLAEGSQGLYPKATLALDRIVIPSVLRHVEGNQTRASELLGISRGTLRQKLRSLGLGIDRVISDEPPDETDPAVT